MDQSARPNVYTDHWERSIEHGPFALRGTRVGASAGARALGATVYELDPGRRNMPYHAHHGIEELLVVLRGTPTLRTPAGERELAEGETVSFPAGSAGAHQLVNRSDRTVRFLILSSKSPADVIEYPDSGRVALHAGEWGTPAALSMMLSAEPQLGYFDGEPESFD